jgi:hypothetical protein
LTSGKLTTGAYELSLAAAAALAGGGSGSYVNGHLQRVFSAGSGQSFTFPVGDGASYAPVALASLNVTSAGRLTASSTGGDQPNLAAAGINSARSVNRYWTLTADGGLAAGSCDATFEFVPGDVDAGADPALFVVRRYAGGSWFATTPGPRTGTRTTASGLTAFGDFALGEDAPPVLNSRPVTIQSLTVAGGNATLTWNAVTGQTYRLQYKSDFAAASWNDVPGDVPATGDTATKVHPLGADPQRLYRVVLVP